MNADSSDEGYSLVDLIVATGIMVIIMVAAFGAIMEVYRDVNRTDGISTAQDQVGNSFRRLDKEFRYATWVSTPGQVGSTWYLEYAVAYIPATPSPTSTATAVPTTSSKCVQLAFRNGVLTRAEWSLPGTTPGTPMTIATDLTLVTATPTPFLVYTPGTKPYASASPSYSGVGTSYELEHSQVRLQFNSAVGKTSLRLDALFTAQNTNRNTSAANDCSKGRPAS